MIIFSLLFVIFAAFGAFLTYSSISGIKQLLIQNKLEDGVVKGYQSYLTTLASNKQGSMPHGFNPANLSLKDKPYQEYIKLYVIVEMPGNILARLEEGIIYVSQPSDMSFSTFKANIYSVAHAEANRLYPVGSTLTVRALPTIYTNREVFMGGLPDPEEIIPQEVFQWKQAFDVTKQPPKIIQFVFMLLLALTGVAIVVYNLWMASGITRG